MGTRYNREEVLSRLRGQMDAGESLLVVGAGNGLVARCAEAAGADLVVVYNSGYYRLNGHPSMVGNLPVGDANQIMLDLGSRNVIPATKSIPVIGGVYGVDPTRDMGRLLESVSHAGYSGVINFPTVGRIDGQYRKDLEAAGLGFGNEVNMIAKARSQGLFTLCYVYNAEDAIAMTNAGVDVVVGHVGLTAGGDVGSKNAMALETAIDKLDVIFKAARSVRNDVIVLSHGGPISSPEEAELVNSRTGAAGFVAASSIERIPIEGALKDACRAFKGIKVGS